MKARALVLTLSMLAAGVTLLAATPAVEANGSYTLYFHQGSTNTGNLNAFNHIGWHNLQYDGVNGLYITGVTITTNSGTMQNWCGTRGTLHVDVNGWTTWYTYEPYTWQQSVNGLYFGFAGDLSSHVALRANVDSTCGQSLQNFHPNDYITVYWRSVPPSAPANAWTEVGPGSGELTIRWWEPTNVGSSQISSYVLRGYREGQHEQQWTTVPGSARSFVATQLDVGYRYCFSVAAVSGAGTSAYTSAGCQVAPGVPSAPRNLGAVGGLGQIALNWQAPSNPGSPAFTQYRVHVATASGGPYTVLALVGSSVTSYTHVGLGASATRCYVVTAQNSIGQSAQSAEACATTFSPPAAPENAAAVGGANEVSVSWAAPASDGGSPVTSYRVYTAAASGGDYVLAATVGASTLEYAVGGLENSETLCFVVAAVSAAGEGDASEETCGTTYGTPSAPRDLAVGPGAGVGVTLTWTVPEDDGRAPGLAYNVYRDDGSGEFTLVGTTAETSYDDAGCPMIVTCTYRVTAENVVGESDASNEASFVSTLLAALPRLG